MKKILLFLILAFFSYCSLLAQSINYNVSYSPYTITDTLCNDSTIYNKISISDCDLTLDVGKPILPVKHVRLLIPNGTRATNVIINQTSIEELQTLSHKVCYATPPIPIGESIENLEEGFDTLLYSQSTPYPASRVSIVSQNFFRGNCIVTIAVYPILYTPAENQIAYLSDINFSLEYISDSNYQKDMYFEEKDKAILSYMIDNPNDIIQFAPINLSPAGSGTKSISVNAKYLVVTERKLLPAFAELLDWKRRKGLPSQAVAIEDILADSDYPGDSISNIYDDAGKLRRFLFDAYQQGVEYVLLAGANIPIRKGTSHDNPHMHPHIDCIDDYIIPTDSYFADFDGNWNVDSDIYYGESQDAVDLISEIYIGRIMPRNEWEVKNWIRKQFIYEQNPGNGDGSYLTKGFFTQADDMQKDREFLTHWLPNIFWMNYYTLFEEEGGYNTPVTPDSPKGANVINEFNNNYGIVSFLAHGSPNRVAVATKEINSGDQGSKYFVTSFDSDYHSYMVTQETGNGLDNMTNYCHPTVFYSISCTTMPFDNYDKWGEGYRRNMGDMYTCVAKGGGPAYLGNTRFGLITASSNLAGIFFDFMLKNQIFNLGKAEAISKSQLGGRPLLFTHNLMGCPETEIWTAIPNSFNNVSILENGNSLLVNAGINDATICVMSALDNGESFYQKIDNISSFNFQNIPKPYNITITKHNYLPYILNTDNIYIQNVNWNNVRVISANKFFIGSNVTNTMPAGNVIIDAPANIILKSNDDVIIESGFEVRSGASFEIKINNSDENICL